MVGAFSHIGAARSEGHWTQVFGKGKNGLGRRREERQHCGVACLLRYQVMIGRRDCVGLAKPPGQRVLDPSLGIGSCALNLVATPKPQQLLSGWLVRLDFSNRRRLD